LISFFKSLVDLLSKALVFAMIALLVFIMNKSVYGMMETVEMDARVYKWLAVVPAVL